MAIGPQRFREIVFQILYSYDLGGKGNDAIIPLLMKELSTSKRVILEAKEIADRIVLVLPKLDALIAGVSHSYEFHRIQTVERNVLRLGAYELLFEPQLPPKVAIAEAMRICSKFTTPEAARFVNAILDILYKRNRGEESKNVELQEAIEALLESERKTQDVPLTAKRVEDES